MTITKDEIRVRITTDAHWTCRAVLALYERQTADERFVQGTKETNGQGFSKFDAEFLSSIAQQLQQGRTLSPRQLEIVQKKIGKYAGQLFKIAQQKELDNAIERAKIIS